uniref:GntR family transcriptional regulator n=1 Tax=Citrobacter amalonaticus TaxID=35703 RepID=UPI000AE2D4A4
MIDGKTASEIFDSIRQHVTSGVLSAGETLPPVRELAAQPNVNRNTVAATVRGNTVGATYHKVIG